jgi:hypothetical protein
MKRVAVLVTALAVALPFMTRAAAPSAPSTNFTSKLEWRNIGPFVGGRVVAVAGVPNQPNVFYFGGVDAGVWRSTDYGLSWTNLSDSTLPASTGNPPR